MKIAIVLLSILSAMLFTACLFLILIVISISGNSKNQGSAVTAPPVTEVPHDIQLGEVYSYINEIRAERGLSALAVDTRLEASACAKAHDMIARNYWAHEAPDGTEPWVFISNAGYNFSQAGENLAAGHMSSAATVEGWKNSPSHLDNIIGNFTHMGLCNVYGKLPAHGAGEENLTVNHFAR